LRVRQAKASTYRIGTPKEKLIMGQITKMITNEMFAWEQLTLTYHARQSITNN